MNEGYSLFGENALSLVADNMREGDTPLVGKNTLVGETLLLGESSLVEEKILEGESVLEGDEDVIPTALLRMPENGLLVMLALFGVLPVADARFTGKSRGLLRGWTVELVGKALLLSTIPAPNRELPGNILSDVQAVTLKTQ